MEKQGLPVVHLYHMLHSRIHLAVFLSSLPCPAPGFISSCAGFFLLQLQNFDNVLLSDEVSPPSQFDFPETFLAVLTEFFFHMNIYHHLFLFFINSPLPPTLSGLRVPLYVSLVGMRWMQPGSEAKCRLMVCVPALTGGVKTLCGELLNHTTVLGLPWVPREGPSQRERRGTPSALESLPSILLLGPSGFPAPRLHAPSAEPVGR